MGKARARQFLNRTLATAMCIAAFSVFPKVMPKTDVMPRFGIPAAQAKKVKKDARVKKLIRDLEGPDKEEQWMAARTLLKMGKRAVPALVGELETGSARIAKMLEKIGKPAVPQLIKASVSSECENKSVEFCDDVTGVVKKIGRQAIPALKRALKNKDPEMRSGAAWLLGIVGGPRAVSALIKASTDRDPNVRYKVVESLGLLEDTSALPVLFRLKKKDRDESVREGAETAINSVLDAFWGESEPEI
jgi:HEAT repeat protein